MAQTPTKTATFLWEGNDRKGLKVKGEMIGSSIVLIKAQLRKQGITPLKVRKKPTSLFQKKGRIKPLDIALFTRQLATMLTAGVPLMQSFEIIAEGLENPTMARLVEEVRQDVAAGDTLANAFRKRPQQFDELYCNLVEAGEQAGQLEALLKRIAIYKEKTELLKKKVRKAMMYPTCVVAVAIFVSAIMLLWVVPQFQAVYQGFGAELPWLTMMVIGVSELLQQYWLFAFGGAFLGGYLALRAYRRNKRVRDAVDRKALKMPILGSIIYKSSLARYARTLSTTFAAGVPLVSALESVAGATGNIVFREAVESIRGEVAGGTQLNFAMRQTKVFPAMAIQMAAIGEEAGSLDEMLDRVATVYEEDVDQLIDGLTSMLEPLIMVVLGGVIGVLIIAMYLPIFKLGSVI